MIGSIYCHHFWILIIEFSKSIGQFPFEDVFSQAPVRLLLIHSYSFIFSLTHTHTHVNTHTRKHPFAQSHMHTLTQTAHPGKPTHTLSLLCILSSILLTFFILFLSRISLLIIQLLLSLPLSLSPSLMHSQVACISILLFLSLPSSLSFLIIFEILLSLSDFRSHSSFTQCLVSGKIFDVSTYLCLTLIWSSIVVFVLICNNVSVYNCERLFMTVCPDE